jgi:general secretion pathway protein J
MKRLPILQSSHASRSYSALGFTLLELMIAMSIFSIMGLAAYRLLSGETRLQTELEAHSLELQQWQRGMRRLSDDLRQIAPRPIRLEYGDNEDALYGTSDSLHLTRYGWSNPLHKTRSQLQRIEYRLASFENDSGVNKDFGSESSYQFLQRQVWAVLDRAPDSEPLQQQLLPQVSDLSWRYMDDDKQWHSQWPATQGYGSSGSSTDNGSNQKDSTLPLAIELTLSSQRFGEITRLIVLRAFSEDTSS